jgi:predicted ATP-grasp superfamily ATP-dependent carboligase
MHGAKAQWILYADEAFETPLNFAWPAWVADVPESGTKVAQHAPICTILAEAENAELAQALVLQRAEKLKGMILK